jgi:hypothetical protein
VGLASSDIEGKRYHAPFIAIKLLSGLISRMIPELTIVVAGLFKKAQGTARPRCEESGSSVQGLALWRFDLLTLD